ncbi:MAG TPA: cytochrome c maturation protein CcmE [Armatimonadota bacterium]|jgi:cytochrome c-type biogenesis protein CcmE
MSRAGIWGSALILAFGGLGYKAFQKSVTPYVSVPEARASHDIVQVYGAINQAQLHFNRQSSAIEFPLTDLKHNTMVVHYRGVRPGNMAQATHCVATGQWQGDHFEAQTLLIKCPSKYQGEKKA